MNQIPSVGKSELNGPTLRLTKDCAAFAPLLNESFVARFAMLGTAQAVWSALKADNDVRRIADQLRLGRVSEASLKKFAAELVQTHVVGQTFWAEPALCGLSIILAERRTAFSEQFLSELAATKTSAVALARRVARLCVSKRTRVSFHMETTDFRTLSRAPQHKPMIVETQRIRSRGSHNRWVRARDVVCQ